jgi:hypothetical protein
VTFLLLAGLGASAAMGEARISLGQYVRWGAFRDADGRCFAASEPIGSGPGRRRPFVAISRGPGGGPPRLHVVPSREPAADKALEVVIGDRIFVLRGPSGRDAREDQRIVAAIRRGDRLRVRGVDTRGGRFHDDYPLAGAPSAIDAAIVGCL